MPQKPDIPITDERIEQYIMGLAPESDPLLLDMEQYARERDFPIVDRLVGRLLYLLASIRQPRLVVELGSGFGYSAYWFARAMREGRIVLTDRSADNLERARSTFSKAGFTVEAEFHEGDALGIANNYRDIDILFIDLDKKGYPDAIRALRDRLSPGALVIADNTLWYGRVASGNTSPETQAVMEFNRMMFEDKEFFSTIVPLRDGVLIAVRQ